MDTQIGQRVKKLRKEFGYDQRQMAERFGVSLRSYQNREHGSMPFPVSELATIAEMFSVSVGYLVTGSDGGEALSEEEKRLLRGWRKIDDKDKRFILGIITDALLEIAEKD